RHGGRGGYPHWSDQTRLLGSDVPLPPPRSPPKPRCSEDVYDIPMQLNTLIELLILKIADNVKNNDSLILILLTFIQLFRNSKKHKINIDCGGRFQNPL